MVVGELAGSVFRGGGDGAATPAALCEVLDCQPGDLLRWEAEEDEEDEGSGEAAAG